MIILVIRNNTNLGIAIAKKSLDYWQLNNNSQQVDPAKPNWCIQCSHYWTITNKISDRCFFPKFKLFETYPSRNHKTSQQQASKKPWIKFPIRVYFQHVSLKKLNFLFRIEHFLSLRR